MGFRSNGRCRKFYEKSIEDIENALKDFYDNSAAKMTKERYLMMMEQLGKEPIPEEIPKEFSDFPFEVQEAINIFSILPDVWEGMSGTYMGKNYSILPYLMTEIFKVDNPQLTMKYLLIIGNIVMTVRSREQETRNRKAKQKAGKKGI